MDRNLKALELVQKWAAKIGPKEAKKRLINRHVGIATADKIVRNKYPSEPGDMITAILLEEMAKDGIALPGAKAS
jgi:hypothetical protein